MLVRTAISRNENNGSFQFHNFPEDLGPHGMLLKFSDHEVAKRPVNRYSLTSSNGPQITITNESAILLPIPGNLVDSTTTKLNKQDFGLTGDMMNNAFSNLVKDPNGLTPQSMTNLIKDFFSGVQGGSLYDNISNATQFGAYASYLLKKARLDTPGDIVGSASSRAANPKSALIFDGVEFKTHSFSWTLMPRSENESKSIRNIIRLLKNKQLPGYEEDTIDGGRLFLTYPSIVEIRLIGVVEDYFTQFKPCMISSVNINYTPNNGAVALMKGGVPAAVSIELNLMEMDIHTKEDYNLEQ